MASCSESTLQEEQPEYVDVSLSAYASDIFINEVRSRSGDDAMPAGCKVRYVIEAWSTDDNPILFYRGVETKDDLTSGLNHSFRIIAGEYDFLFWADYVSSSASNTTADNHYNTDTSDGLKNVTIINDDSKYTASNLSRDCFAGQKMDVTVSSSVDMGSIKLSRPMAKLVVKNSDASAVGNNKSVSITFTESIPNGHNVWSGDVITDEDITPTYPNTTEDDEELAFDYIFMTVPTTYDITMTIDGKTRTSTATPFEPNTITNITSNFFETTD